MDRTPWQDTPAAMVQREAERIEISVIAAIMAKDLHPEAFNPAILELRASHV